MARKRRGKGQRRRKNAGADKRNYDELDKYPVRPPHAFARVVRDRRSLNILYQVIEPPLSKKEEKYRQEIMDIFVKSLNASIEDIEADAAAYLRTSMDKVIKSYGMKINKKSKSKLCLLYTSPSPRD